jgi:hypothetical protein
MKKESRGPPDFTFTQDLYDEAVKKKWTVSSMKADWKRMFAFDEK